MNRFSAASRRSPAVRRIPAARRSPAARLLVNACALLLLAGAPALAQGGAGKISGADTAWVLVSAALVLLMTPGLALFYGGMVRTKNVLGMLTQNFIAIGIIGLQWILFGYSLAFAPDLHHLGLIGDLRWMGLSGVGLQPDSGYSSTIPAMAFMIYQCMFAIITPALITGAIAERMKFSTYVVFILLWATLVYDPVAHWVWGTGGWLHQMGTLDFAGGIVVHVTSGFSALVAALIIGKRRGYPAQEMRPHNLVWTILGTGLLWFGWFGFNAGSALGANGVAVLAFTTTNTAAGAGALSWMAAEWLMRRKPTALGMVSGAVAGLAGITPASGFVGVLPAVLIGAVAGLLCYGAVSLKPRLGYDDTLDTFGVHGISGTWGALATGIFACAALTGLSEPNGAPSNGLLYGNPHQLVAQAAGVVAVLLYSVVVTFILFKALDLTMGLRVDPDSEETGLDLSQHGEEAYLHL